MRRPLPRAWCLNKEKECLVTEPGSPALLSVPCRVGIMAYTLPSELRQVFPCLKLEAGDLYILSWLGVVGVVQCHQQLVRSCAKGGPD